MKTWFYNESKHCGVDYSDVKHVEGYDSLHQQFRDFDKEFTDMLDFIGPLNTQELTVIDLGCGTGALTFSASEKFKSVYAVDISDTMIAQAKKKVASDSINNIEFHIGGFLSYKHHAPAVDVILTKHAFHHLPDFWKQIAIFRMNKMLKMDGILYICDVVFGLESHNYQTKIDKWVSGFERNAGKELRSEVEIHIKEEFSTYDWILEGMFTRAGFLIEKSRSADGFIREYLCRKSKEIEYEE